MMKFLISGVFIGNFLFAAAQFMSPEEAVQIALKNNYDILVARNDADIAKANNTLGNAGMLPTAAVTASDNYSLNNIQQKLTNGNVIKASNAGGNNLNAAAAINWTLFDGGKMFITKKKLTELQQLGELQFKDKVLQTVNDVVVSYYDIVRQKKQLSSIVQLITYNQERVKIFDNRLQAGLSAKTDVLQAKVDLNVNKEALLNQKITMMVAKQKLNQLLSREPNVEFDVLDSIPLQFTWNKEEFKQKIFAQNPSLLSLEKQATISQLAVKEFKTLYLPKISINSSYAFARSDNKAGFTLFSQTFGPQFGGALSIPLYQAGNVKRQVEVAKIQAQSAQYAIEKTKLNLLNQLQTAQNDYENQQSLLEIEKETTTLAQENLTISLARLKLGQTNTLELRLAETTYQNSLARLSNFEFNLKVAETKLRQLMADL